MAISGQPVTNQTDPDHLKVRIVAFSPAHRLYNFIFIFMNTCIKMQPDHEKKLIGGNYEPCQRYSQCEGRQDSDHLP